MRSKRPIEVASASGDIKGNFGVRKFLLRGLEKVKIEWILYTMFRDFFTSCWVKRTPPEQYRCLVSAAEVEGKAGNFFRKVDCQDPLVIPDDGIFPERNTTGFQIGDGPRHMPDGKGQVPMLS